MSEKREELLRRLAEENRKSTAEGLFLLQAVAERSGMNLTDLQCISILSSTGPITAGRLAEEMGLTTGSVTGVIDRMERAGYVRRERDPNDKRRVIVCPVPEKLEHAGVGFLGAQDREFEQLMSEYDDRDLALFLDFMRKANAINRRETERIRAELRGGEGGEFSAPLGSARSGRLVFAGGAARLILRADSGMDDLYRARFEGPVPKVEVADGIVTFRYPRRLGVLFEWRNRSGGEVTLSTAVPWEVEVRGGAYKVEADLSGLRLTSFVLTRGFSNVALTLPEPSGVVPIRLSGGASKVTIRRPAGVEAHLNMRGGASKLVFDGQSFEAVGGTLRLQSPDSHNAADRYEIEISGGASEITVTTSG
ncbi:MarR family winged helix-turn-helix transcriptional regulator [Rubrobacter calidifluminis]|uniref:MarR family winged helix-turn-helix transcriptional regulator n=1 Tax=Rubrobacter calidifluminis TaxID=1392640 RepID=UPI002360F43B|nr:MarR family transcriptional regulator [Rubrobacter calidifluminis]